MSSLLGRITATAGLCVLLAGVHASSVLPAPGSSAAPSVVVSAALQNRVQAEGTARVLVELRLQRGAFVSEGRLDRAAAASQRRDIKDKETRVLARLDSKQHRVTRRFSTVPLIALEVGSDALRELQNADGLVYRVVEDDIVYPSLGTSVPLVQGDRLWAQGFDGTGEVVAVLDTGVDSSHPFLLGKVVEEACYSSNVSPQSTTLCPNGQEEQVGPGAGVNCPLALFGCDHGTHVAGIAAGNGGPAGRTFSGVAKGASVMAIQVFSRFDRFQDCGFFAPCVAGWSSDVIAGLERVYLLRDQYSFASANMSLGEGSFSSTCDLQPYKPVIDNLRSVGIASVVASGNDGSANAMSAPACISSAVSVASTTKTDGVSYFSNVTPFLSLFAPGDPIQSSVPGGGYASFQGTSMAAPHVAGAWAALKQAAPSASVDTVLAALQQSGKPITDFRNGVTKPRIQLLGALARVLPERPFVETVTPSSGGLGQQLTVTVTGLNFGSGTSVSFGAGVTVEQTSTVSATELTATVVIAEDAALGARDVTVVNASGESTTVSDGFLVTPPPPSLSLRYEGKLRDRVGKANGMPPADRALDATFKVTVEPGSGARTVTQLELSTFSGSGRWDTIATSAPWILGAAAGLDSPLLNTSNGSVSFATNDGQSFYLFAGDTAPSQFNAGAQLRLRAVMADGSSTTTDTTLSAPPTVSAVSPQQALRGQTLSVTVTGSNFQSGGTVSFGAGTNVTATSVGSPTSLTATVVIAGNAAFGPRDVTVSNPDGVSGTLPAGFSITPPAATLSLRYEGKLRDRVGKGNGLNSGDGSLDATFKVTVEAGSGPRTVTQLELSILNGIGRWDTIASTPQWSLGAAATLDTPLLNTSTGAVNFATNDGPSFYLFAGDPTPSPFVANAQIRLRTVMADGSSTTTDTTLSAPPTISAVSPQQAVRGQTLSVTVTGSNFQTGATVSFGAGTNVTATTIGSATSLTATVVIDANATPGTRDVTVINPSGSGATLTAGFTITAVPAATLTLRYEGKLRDKVGKGNGLTAPDGSLDATFKVTVEAGSGPRTVTQLELWALIGTNRWDTVRATPQWILGTTTGLDSTLLNNTSNDSVSFATSDGQTFYVFAGDPSNAFPAGTQLRLLARFADGTTATADTTVAAPPTVSAVSPQQAVRGQTLSVTVTGSNFQTGATVSFGAGTNVTATTIGSATSLTATVVIDANATPGTRDVTVINPSGSGATLTAGFTITAVPAATLTLRYEGKLRDKVGKGNGLTAPDGSLDATFKVTVEAGSGPRTVTQLELWALIGTNRWDTVRATPQWILGTTTGLDSTLLNNTSNDSVSFATSDGQTFYVFAGDPSNAFPAGTQLRLLARFADGTTATADTTIP